MKKYIVRVQGNIIGSCYKDIEVIAEDEDEATNRRNLKNGEEIRDTFDSCDYDLDVEWDYSSAEIEDYEDIEEDEDEEADKPLEVNSDKELEEKEVKFVDDI